MDTLVNDVLVEIFKLVNTQTLIKFSLCSKSNLDFFRKNIKKFKIICNNITDQELEFLKGAHTIDLSDCNQITNKGLVHLKGVHTIDLYNCNQITDQGIQHLKGAQIYGYINRTRDEAFQYLKMNVVDISLCAQISDEASEYLRWKH